uniref:DNA-directed RNA polymerase RpoA/D/Rpb3-type domain-containing protein n=1 Tax=viral metagenome TaxID=1070528 RepID=A0A6C0HZU5_9ZZZZ
MNPILQSPSEENDIYRFTLAKINLSLANALRRTILNDIPTVVIRTETYADNKCKFEINTGRLHNELLKQRLSSIPIHISNEKELETFYQEYILEVDVQNNSDTIQMITTEDFKIKHKESGKYMTREDVRSIFPPDPLTLAYIDFARLRPKIGDTIPGEHIKFSAEFSMATAGINSMFNVVSKCSYGNTIDMSKVESAWEVLHQKSIAEDMTKEEIEYKKRNYYLLDAQRTFIPDSYDFVIQTVGVFDNKYIIKKACNILKDKFINMVQLIESDAIPIGLSETTMENSYDITLENEDYTVGKVLEYILYESFYEKEQLMNYCGFKKFHPHDTSSKIRVAYLQTTDKHLLREHLKRSCIQAIDVFEKIRKMF